MSNDSEDRRSDFAKWAEEMSYEEEIWPCAVDKARDKLHDINKEFGENAQLIKMELIAD